jgi:hypothetical protein
MTRFLVRAMLLTVVLAAVVAAPAASQVIPKGTDFWRTPASGTVLKFPQGDVEGLCKAQPDPAWNHQVTLRGIPAQGSDWDSAVARLDPATFDRSGNAKTRVQFRELRLISTAASDTPCGKVMWTARLARGKQPITNMTITKRSDKGGTFSAELALRVEIQANKADTGEYVGSLLYDIKLPDPKGGTPWSFGPAKEFRPGMTEANDCIQVLRQKLSTFDPSSSHYYFISDLIAKGQCRKEG